MKIGILKRICPGIAVLLLLTACSETPNDNHVTFIDKATHEVTMPMDLSTRYDAFFRDVDKLNIDAATRAFFEFESVATKAQLDFVETVVLDSEIQDALANCYNNSEIGFDIGCYHGEKKDEIQDICDHGFTFVPFNGLIYPVVNYEDFDRVSPYVSREASSYIALKAHELNDYMIGSSLSQEDLIDRLLSIETHLKAYAGGQTAPTVYELYKTYLYDFIPIELRTLGKLSEDDERLKTYQFFADAHETSVTAAIVSKYVNAIKDNGYVINASVLEVLDNFNDEIELYFTHVNT
ncbi:hypothetical protein KHM83_07035 [Fusibacter paucivorans]|uniref:Uncharacterized protein n=1 Tax=Fusibacter paucivorans TaxID=76009 RepID=A0ABS5PQV0_9FIRM|nr:hypothetical protein [Fusibacter paucivorans]MBS7526427.1 hypothetical protein [Fusibacter paucivorans]